jgi:hypothetical protein
MIVVDVPNGKSDGAPMIDGEMNVGGGNLITKGLTLHDEKVEVKVAIGCPPVDEYLNVENAEELLRGDLLSKRLLELLNCEASVCDKLASRLLVLSAVHERSELLVDLELVKLTLECAAREVCRICKYGGHRIDAALELEAGRLDGLPVAEPLKVAVELEDELVSFILAEVVRATRLAT